MKKILSIEDAIVTSKTLRKQKKQIVLAGGCFDILHIGHISFLKEARNKGDVLFVMLESDEAIKHSKGPHRPLNTQADRAEILSHLVTVDFVILMPSEVDNTIYDNVVNLIKPAIIATTAGDPGRHHKERQAKQGEAIVVDVTNLVINQSTSRLVDILQEL